MKPMIALVVAGALVSCGGSAAEDAVPRSTVAPVEPSSTEPPSTTSPPGAPEATTVSPTTEAPTTTTTVAPPTTTVSPTTTAAPATTIPEVDPYEGAPRFLALGDSYTIGQSVDYAERWPAQLVALLRDAGLPVADPEFIAETGWTTSRLARAIEEASPDGPYGLVSLQIGVNNQFRGGDLDVFRTELRDLLARGVELAQGDPRRVLVLTIPDYSVTPFAENLPRARISYEVGLFNDILAEEAAAAGTRLVDVTPSSKKAADDPDLLAFDGLHPSGLMYEEWAELVLPEATAALQTIEELSDTR